MIHISVLFGADYFRPLHCQRVRNESFPACVVVILGVQPFVVGSGKKVTWEDTDCLRSFRFDPTKYSEESIWNTIHLIFGPADFGSPFVDFGFRPQDYEKYDFAQFKFDFDHLKQQCTSALSRAKELSFVPLSGIEDYRRALIDEIEDTCNFSTIEMHGATNPPVLREYPRAAACAPFVDALEGKSDIKAMFRQMLVQSCEKNVSQRACVDTGLTKDMRVQVLVYGWHNCANNFRIENTDAKRRDQMHAQLEKQFRRQFKVKEIKCEPPVD